MIYQQDKHGHMITLLVILVLTACVFMPGVIASADDEYPSKPVIINVGFTPGGFSGNAAQIFAEAMERYLPKKQPVLCNYKPGAGTALSATYVLTQPADGYNLLWFNVDLAVKLAEDGGKLSFNLDDFNYVGTVGHVPIVLPVREDSRFRNLKEFVDYAKKHPGELSFGSSGFGAHGHLTGEILQDRCGIKLTHVPFPGSAPSITAMLGGHIDMITPSLGSITGYIKPGGGMRILAVLTPERLTEVPNVPTALEQGINYIRFSWVGLAAPKNTPAPTMKIIREAYNKAIKDPKLLAGHGKLGLIPQFKNGEEMKKMAEEELKADREIFKKLGRN